MKKIISLMLAIVMLFSVTSSVTFGAQAKDLVSGEDIVAYARTFIGYPYKWGTQGPDSFDCSGFVQYVFKHFGINLPASSSEYWNNPTKYGTVIATNSTEKAQAGDVVSWDGHVAIYTENGNKVEALNSKYGVTERLPVARHRQNSSNNTYRVIRIYGVVSKAENVNEEDAADVFDDAPVLQGWQKIDNKWYYYKEDGTAKQYWNKIDGKWYYFTGTGEMRTGWIKIKGYWYYLASSGEMVMYWKKIGNKWYYMTSSGVMKTGWLKAGGKWYYLDSENGDMFTGKHKIKGVWYTFNSSGALNE